MRIQKKLQKASIAQSLFLCAVQTFQIRNSLLPTKQIRADGGVHYAGCEVFHGGDAYRAAGALPQHDRALASRIRGREVFPVLPEEAV